MNTTDHRLPTPLSVRRHSLRAAAAVHPATPRFSDEVEGEGCELFLRGLLVACLLSALALSQGPTAADQRAPAAQPGRLVAATQAFPARPAPGADARF